MGPSTSAAPLPTPVKIAYATGALSDSIKTFCFTTFLLFYYTTILGLPASWLAAAMSIGLVWDAVIDPLIGHLSDRARARSLGRHGFMLLGGIGAGAAFIAVFNPPRLLSGATLLGWLVVSTLCVRSANSLFMVPYYALGSELSGDRDERTSISGYRAAAVLAGTLLATLSAFLVLLPEQAAGGNRTTLRSGYGEMGVVFGVAMTAVSLAAVVATFRYPRRATSRPAECRMRLHQTLATLARHRRFRTVVLASSLSLMANAINAALALYFLTYHAGIRDSRAISMYFSAIYAGSLLGVSVWVQLTKRFHKHHVYAFATAATALVMSAGYWLVGAGRPFGVGNVAVVAVASSMAGFFGVAGAVIVPSMIADITGEDERDTGWRRDGTFFGVYSFGQQIAGGLAVIGAGVLVDRFARLAPAQPTQSPETIERLAMLSNLLPAAILVAAAAVALRYDRGAPATAVAVAGYGTTVFEATHDAE
jgi:GPH family glycoside/pentoside/hexuronide:cation symporter